MHKQTSKAIIEMKHSEHFVRFERMQNEISWMPLYDEKVIDRIKAIQWVFSAFSLINEGIIDPKSPFYVHLTNT